MVQALITGGLALGSTLGKFLTGRAQRRRADRLRNSLSDPGILRNYGLERASEILGNNYSKYNLPGLTSMLDNIRSNQAAAVSQGVNAATSSGDVLDLVTRAQDVTNNATQNVLLQNAQGKQDALNSWLNSLNAVGQDQVRVNQLENARYQQGLAEAAALEGAGIQNQSNSLNEAISGINALYNTNFVGRDYVNQQTGKIETLPSLWDTYWARKKGGN